MDLGEGEGGDEPYATVVAEMVAAVIGLSRVWPGSPEAPPQLATALLELLVGWADDPVELDAWSEPGQSEALEPIELADETVLMARAAGYLESTYADFYAGLSAPSPDAGTDDLDRLRQQNAELLRANALLHQASS